MLPFIGALVAQGSAPGAVGPSGDPTFATVYLYGGDLAGVQWVTGDPDAYTQLGLSEGGAIDPSEVFDTAMPGQTSLETGGTTTEYFWVRHLRNDIAGDWVRAFVGE